MCCGVPCPRYPAHIHILKVNPDSRDRVQAGKLWGAESKKGGAQEDEAADGDEVGFSRVWQLPGGLQQARWRLELHASMHCGRVRVAQHTVGRKTCGTHGHGSPFPLFTAGCLLLHYRAWRRWCGACAATSAS